MSKNKVFPIRRSLFILTALIIQTIVGVTAGGSYDPTQQSDALIYNEAQTVYLGNVARQNEAGQPPLRWSQQLTQASRWFSWDSVENRPDPYCGHQDTLGGWPGDRALTYGYLGGAGAENAFCGYVTPQQAIDGWLNSEGHRANLLAEGHREIGLGYYLRDSDGRGYVAQMFGADAVYPPVIIDNEAIATADPNVDGSSGIQGMHPYVGVM